MPTPTPQGAIWLYQIRSLRDGQRCITSIVCNNIAAISNPDYVSFCNQFLFDQENADTLLSKYLDCISISSNSVVQRIQCISPSRLAFVERIGAGAWSAGTRGAVGLPSNVGSAITRRSLNGTRAGVGTLHIPAPGPTDVADSLWIPPYRITLQALAAKTVTPLTLLGGGAAMQPILWDRRFPGVIWDVVSAVPQPQVRVNRRRTVGVGI